jgi:hypothetical protein
MPLSIQRCRAILAFDFSAIRHQSSAIGRAAASADSSQRSPIRQRLPRETLFLLGLVRASSDCGFDQRNPPQPSIQNHHEKLVLTFLTSVALTSGMSANAAVTVNWTDWNAPGSYPLSASTLPATGWWGNSIEYASGTTGSITMPDSTVVGVTFTGEILQDGGASVFTTAAPSLWISSQGTPSAYISETVPSLPPTDTRIGLSGYGNPTQSITFSQSVENIVLIIRSLGSSTIAATWTFTQPFVVLSEKSTAPFTVSGGNTELTGMESNGVIQFLGTFDSFSWTVSAAEIYSNWNLGVSSVSAPDPSPVPEPGQVAASVLLLAGIGGYVWMKRRKTAKPAVAAV